jgi:cold shock CspA family protein
MDSKELFLSRPFRIRNADEYDSSSILNLFVNPLEGLATPFDFENVIVKGRMGSGKTMYLRANHAYYISCLVPSLIERSNELILPVLIRLSDFQHLTQPQDVYRAIIIKLIEELSSIYLHLENMKTLANIQVGLRHLPDQALRAHKVFQSMKLLSTLGSEEYVERVSTELGLKSGIKPKFLELSAEFKKTNFSEIKKKPNPGIKDVEECYRILLEDQDGKILLLIDEAGSLDKSFFKNNGDSLCFFEILMNQFRTSQFIRTKIAVYPNSYSDLLTETRYGDTVLLEESVLSDDGYLRFRKKALAVINNYLNSQPYLNSTFDAGQFFDLSETYGDCLEQLMYASSGNMRRLIQLLDLAMDSAYSENGCPTIVTKDHAVKALRKHAEGTELSFTRQEVEFLGDLVSVCKSRGTFKFQFPNVPLYKYTGRSQEYNIIAVDQLGSGRRATIYAFDYAYCVLKDIPTHRMVDSEKINRDRTNESGRWLARVATINQEVIDHAGLPGKAEGTVEYVNAQGTAGFITSDTSEQFFFVHRDVIEADRGKRILIGTRIRFYPTNLEDAKMAVLLEVLS